MLSLLSFQPAFSNGSIKAIPDLYQLPQDATYHFGLLVYSYCSQPRSHKPTELKLYQPPSDPQKLLKLAIPVLKSAAGSLAQTPLLIWTTSPTPKIGFLPCPPCKDDPYRLLHSPVRLTTSSPPGEILVKGLAWDVIYWYLTDPGSGIHPVGEALMPLLPWRRLRL
ncbi:hypothetical protein DSO57_1004649 [Entomophthora muscae]|uniref:Uncharacterized protein n=1 Tax=Entomophthora muscae TaxID=34485 RepID=A0ACC2T8W7_9FUNG|nr:hypothetical protein DSO57_1004649 [Entomophthora muscae]